MTANPPPPARASIQRESNVRRASGVDGFEAMVSDRCKGCGYEWHVCVIADTSDDIVQAMATAEMQSDKHRAKFHRRDGNECTYVVDLADARFRRRKR